MARLKAYLGMSRVPSAIAELDGLRGIAILLVLGRHGTRVFRGSNEPIYPLGSWDGITPFINGWVGVDLFFVLSGFLITHHILRRWTLAVSWSEIRMYLGKRLLRIVPAYYATLLLAASGWLAFYQLPREGLGRQVVYHLLFLQDYLPASIIVAFWSLGVEEKFYLTIPFVVLLLWRLPSVRERVAVLAGLMSLPLLFRYLTYTSHPELDTYYEYFRMLRSPFHVSLDGLLVGCICAFLHHHRDHFPWLERTEIIRSLFWGGLLLSGYLVCAQPLLDPIRWFNVTLLYTCLALGFGAVLLSLISGRSPCAAFFRTRWLFFFSKISYSLYLVHMMFMGCVYVLLRDTISIERFPVGVQFALYFPLFCVFSIAGALVLHYAVEKPFLILKDRLGQPRPGLAQTTPQSVTA